jgi:hypothetical protein
VGKAHPFGATLTGRNFAATQRVARNLQRDTMRSIEFFSVSLEHLSRLGPTQAVFLFLKFRKKITILFDKREFLHYNNIYQYKYKFYFMRSAI